jgi:hypothetical protein
LWFELACTVSQKGRGVLRDYLQHRPAIKRRTGRLFRVQREGTPAARSERRTGERTFEPPMNPIKLRPDDLSITVDGQRAVPWWPNSARHAP